MKRQAACRICILEVEFDSIHLRFTEGFERSGLSLLSRVLHSQGSKIYRTVIVVSTSDSIRPGSLLEHGKVNYDSSESLDRQTIANLTIFTPHADTKTGNNAIAIYPLLLPLDFPRHRYITAIRNQGHSSTARFVVAARAARPKKSQWYPE